MTAIVKVSLEDVNDNPPEFYPLEYSTNLDKDTVPRTSVITVQATDKDSAQSYGTIGYSILSGNEGGYFRIHLRSGEFDFYFLFHLWPSWLGQQNKLTASLQRHETAPMSVLDMTPHNVMVRLQ